MAPLSISTIGRGRARPVTASTCAAGTPLAVIRTWRTFHSGDHSEPTARAHEHRGRRHHHQDPQPAPALLAADLGPSPGEPRIDAQLGVGFGRGGDGRHRVGGPGRWRLHNALLEV